MVDPKSLCKYLKPDGNLLTSDMQTASVSTMIETLERFIENAKVHVAV